MIVYGIHPVKELVKTSKNQIEHIYFCKNSIKTSLYDLLKLCKKSKIPYSIVPSSRIKILSRSDTHQGVVAITSDKLLIDENDIFYKAENGLIQRILIPSSVQDTHNLGAIIRSAVAFNVDLILLEKKGNAPISSTVYKTSAGMVEHIDIARPLNLSKLLGSLKKIGFTVIGADNNSQKLLSDSPIPKRVILVTGSEHKGIPNYLKVLCDEIYKIQISENVESLNVSVAAAIMMYEINKGLNNES